MVVLLLYGCGLRTDELISLDLADVDRDHCQVFSEALNHASIIDGIRLSKAQRFRYQNGDMQELEQHLQAAIRRHGIRLIGPNCFGLMNLHPDVQLNATYTPAIPPSGRVSIASESGGLGLAVVTAARRLNLGLSGFVSVGTGGASVR